MEKHILITGASKGIGYGTAQYLLKKGYKVILVSRTEDSMKRLQDDYPGFVYVFPFDLSQYEKIEDIFLFCKEKGLKLSGMIHAAGISRDLPLKSVETEDMKETFDLNYFAAAQLGRFFSMKKYSENGASAVFMSSMASFSAERSMSQYTASKCAVNALVKVMAKECVKRRLRINAIAPGFVDTEMTWNERNLVEDFDEKLLKNQPFGVIPVEQIAYLAEFLLSDKSSYMTGAIIPVTGG